MHRLIPLAVLLLMSTCCPLCGQDDVDLATREERVLKQAAALAAPSVVRIETVGGRDRVGSTPGGTGPTTGVIVSADGEIITSSFNFAAQPTSILVTLPDGRRFAAEKVASDGVKMLTLIKIKADNLVPAKPAPRASFRIGQWAIALGRTYPTPAPNVSVGIVSALNRIWGKAIQTDAKVSPVNYGGPLVDIDGRVLGILVPLSPQGNNTTAGVQWYDAGIGFAIPMEDVYGALDRLRAGKDLRQGVMGITFKTKDIYGAAPEIDRVRYDSPAQKAGLKKGDIITDVNGEAVTRIAQIRHLLGSSYEGEQVSLTVRRGENTQQAELTLVGELKPYESAFLGILPERASTEQASEAAGVGIRYIYPDSPAAKIGLAPGDRILRYGDSNITDADELRDAVGRFRPGDELELTVLRGDERKNVTVKLEEIPAVVPETLPPIRPPQRKAKADDGDDADGEGTGRIAETMEGHEHDYWAFIPEDFHPDHEYALLVWIHPGGDTMEADMLEAWKPICRERGIILLGPKAEKVAGWTPNEAGFVKAAVESFLEKYPIDRSRVVMHSYATGGVFATQLVTQDPELFSGVSLAGAPLQTAPPENRPENRLQWYFICGENDRLHRFVELTVQVLTKLRFPVIMRSVPNAGRIYPDAPQLEELGRWIDSLDRI